MSNFDTSRWSDGGFAREYRDQAGSYIPERGSFIEIIRSLYRHLVNGTRPRRILDLGCGDGLLVQELLQLDDEIEATLVDGSSDMLNAARERLSNPGKKHFVHASFQDLLAQDPLPNTYSLVLSSLAIHHLAMADKQSLFQYIYRHLDPGGFFVNFDVVLSPTDVLEKWYLDLWQEWIDAHTAGPQKTSLLPVPQKYKDNRDNVPDPLLPQLQALEKIGFRNVDCFYKHGIFAMFGGSREK